jgi:uncharacterized UPF0160 family protein
MKDLKENVDQQGNLLLKMAKKTEVADKIKEFGHDVFKRMQFCATKDSLLTIKNELDREIEYLQNKNQELLK